MTLKLFELRRGRPSPASIRRARGDAGPRDSVNAKRVTEPAIGSSPDGQGHARPGLHWLALNRARERSADIITGLSESTP